MNARMVAPTILPRPSLPASSLSQLQEIWLQKFRREWMGRFLPKRLPDARVQPVPCEPEVVSRKGAKAAPAPAPTLPREKAPVAVPPPPVTPPARPAEPEPSIPLQALPASPLFQDAMAAWTAFKGRAWTPETLMNAKRMARGWCAIIGTKPLADLTPQDVLAVYQDRDNGKRGGLWLNTERTFLRGFFLWAVDMGLTANNPSRAWPRKRGVVKRKYLALTVEEEERLIAALKPRYRAFVRFAVATGLRLGEIRRIVWGWISSDGILTVPAALRKQRREYSVPLNRKALEALGERGQPEELVLDLSTPQATRRALKRAAIRAGLSPAISPHQFRRTWCSRLLQAGVPQGVVQKLGGWAQAPVMVTHYLTFTDDQARAYLEKA